MSLAAYIDAFQTLNVNRAHGHASPHKVCMLLAVMDLIEQGVLADNAIPFNDALLDKFSHHMKMMGSESDRVHPHLPFYHLRSEPFWHHKVFPGKEFVYESLSRSNSQARVKDAIACAYLDKELYDYLRYSVTREQLKGVLFENIDAKQREDVRGALGGWSKLECELIVRDYLDMLVEELNGHDYSKAEHRRDLQPFLEERSEGSIEYKHQNISAILIDLGLPYIRGYKPAFNYQGLLAEVVEAQVDLRQIQLLESADQPIRHTPEAPLLPDWEAVMEAKPDLEIGTERRGIREYIPRHYNYAAREGHNRHLGMRGEEFVLSLEKRRLAGLGRKDLAKEIEWTSKVRGDGAGYDIRSFNADTDKELFIEVKTTNSGKNQPFIISDNEVAISE